jgi:hypothetical protein
MALIDHAIWKQISQYVKIIPDAATKKSKKRLRIEFSRDMPQHLITAALAVTVPCVSCGKDIHPVRARVPPKTRGSGVAQGLYYAPCCPLKENLGCSRGDAASADYERFRTIFTW